MILIYKTSLYTGKVNSMLLDITNDQIEEWENGKLIQDAMPNLTADEREFMISGATPEDWNEAHGVN